MENIELKELVRDKSFVEYMNSAFSDLRADYELTIDTSHEKIQELQNLHVDVKQFLSTLTSLSRKSSGTICGLRGTGKTHLMLLARHNLNSSLWNESSTNNLCIYLNMKRLTLPEQFDKDLFNRVFSIFIYEELTSQMVLLLKEIQDDSLWMRVQSFFNKKRKKTEENISNIILELAKMVAISKIGDQKIRNIGMGKIEEDRSGRELIELTSGFKSKLSLKQAKLNMEIGTKELEEYTKSLQDNNNYLQYLNVNSVRNSLIKIIELLGIDSITFYVDEWEKISGISKCQEFSASYIDKIIDDPIFFWIGIVPYRGGLYSLDNGADLQHQINLDESLILEASDKDKLACINYFKQIVDKRLEFYFPGKGYTYNMMFNNEDNFSRLVMASMGNTRDFGTMLLSCWSNYQAYRTSQLSPGRPFKYISMQMVNEAIKDNGNKKYSNIESQDNVVKVWNDVNNFCVTKKSSHFAIEEKTDILDCLREFEFSELIYHRLINLRKTHVPAKDTDIENKLSIYAINYAATYSLHSQDKKISFVIEYKTIHDRVRRYIYNPKNILDELKIKSGELFPCISCGNMINPQKMKAAWVSNSCPFCGEKIHK